MVSILRKLFFGIIGLILLFVIIGTFLPSKVGISRNIEISAKPAEVFPYLNNLKLFNQWSPWAQLDPETRYTFTGPESGTGAKMAWQSDSPDVGSGSLEIVASIPNKKVDTILDFGDQGTALASRILQAQGQDQTLVTWSFSTDFGWNLPGRYLGLFLDQMLGPDFEKGLASLNQLVEGNSR